MKTLGILIIINSLIVAGTWVGGAHQHKAWVISLCVLAVFVGIIFTMHDRAIEITFNKVGTIKAAAEQATADAKGISEIKKRIESQSATIDLIAEKAVTTINQLRNIAYTTAQATLTDLMAANFVGGTTLRTRLDLHDQIIASLKEIGVSDDNIRNAETMWRKGVGVIYHRGIHCALEGRTNPNIINMKASPELRKASDEFQNMQDFKQWQVPSPDEMESFIEEKGFMNDSVRELINDYRYFLETGDIRRREVFEKL